MVPSRCTSSSSSKAHAFTSLYHRHIVGILDHGAVSGHCSHTRSESPFLVMERVLGTRLQLGPNATWTQVLAVTRALLASLAGPSIELRALARHYSRPP